MGTPQDPSLLILAGKRAWPGPFWAFFAPSSLVLPVTMDTSQRTHATIDVASV